MAPDRSPTIGFAGLSTRLAIADDWMGTRAGRWMLEELARTPLEFGESRDWLPELNLKVRLAFVRPRVVQFAVNEAERIVFVMAFADCDRG